MDAAPDHAGGQQRPAQPARRLHDPHRQPRTRRTCSASARPSQGGKQPFEFMSRSTNGGANWSQPQPVAGPVQQPGAFDPVQGRPVIDGVAGARSDLAPAPSVDIANGAPTGADATNRIVMSYVSGPLATPHVFFTESTDRGATLVGAAGDRDGGRPRLLHRAGDLAQRHRRLRRLQRVHDAVPADHGDAAVARRRGQARRRTGGSGPTGAFTDAAPQPRRATRERPAPTR